MNRYLTELIGTFFLVLTIGLSVLSGSALMVMVFKIQTADQAVQ